MTSDVPQGISMPPRRISRGAGMAELALIRGLKSFEELAEQLALSSPQYLTEWI